VKSVTRRAVLAVIERKKGVRLQLVPGPSGERGPQGDRGPQGVRGEIGHQGTRGEKGDRGDFGPQGNRGLQGSTGEPGPQGEKGEKGDQGLPGTKGEPGEKGDRGERGIEWRGSFQRGLRYEQHHAVHYLGSSYIARSPTMSLPTDRAAWDVLAAAGEVAPYFMVGGRDSSSSSAASASLDADLNAIAALTGTGWAKRTASDVWTLSTPTASDVGADPAGTSSSALSAHVAAGDPHAQYALESALGALAAQSTITVSQISDAGATGQSIVQAGTAGAAKTALSLAKADVGLGSVDNTSDANKPVSTAQQTALNLKADLASPALTGTPTAPTAAVDTNTTQLATTGFVIAQAYAKLASPALTGNPTAPTAAAGDNDTSIATTAFVGAAVPNSSYRTILDCSGSHTAAKVAGTYALGQGDPLAVSGTGTLYPLNSIFIAAADFPTVNGAAPKLRIRAQLYTNDVAPTGNFTFGLYPITRPATSGGAGLCIFTLGTVVTGSAGASFTTPAADGLLNAVSADFALPADGHYVIGVVTTATVAASSHVQVSASLQLRNA
jgi:hypothetical protein